MIPNTPDRVTFEFADHQLEGRVVDTTTQATYNQRIETVFTVEANGSRYTVPERKISPA